MPIILGIDVSIKDVALTLIKVDDNKVSLIKSYKYILDTSKNIVDKINLLDIWEQPCFSLKIDYVFIERAHFQKAILSRQVELGYYDIIGALVRYFFLECTTLINPSTWKKALGYPNNKNMTVKQKAQLAIDFCKEKYGIEFDDNDKADAFLIGMGGYIKETGTKYNGFN